MPTIKVADRQIGDGHPGFIVAEAGLNHNGDLHIALRLIDAAKQAGADAVKFQKRTVEAILTREALDQPYAGSNSYGATYREHRLALELSNDEWRQLAEYCTRQGIIWFASPWDEESADFLESLDMPVYKIASADLTNIPLLSHVAAKGKPVIISTGMSTMEEIDAGVQAVLEHNPNLIVLHCVSAYPFEPELANLNMIPALAERFPDLVIGYSGHEKSGFVVSLGAALLGAHVIERHLTLDRTMKGPDHAASLEPHGFSQLVENVHKMEDARGDGVKRIYPEEVPIRTKLAKSVTAAQHIKRGSVITREDLTMKSPGDGLTGRFLLDLVGRVTARSIESDEQLPTEALEWPQGGNGGGPQVSRAGETRR